MIKIDPLPSPLPVPAPAALRPRAPGTRYLARDARNADAARPIPPAPIRTPDDRRSPVFDVTDKRAVDRLAAVVAMLEAREATARDAYREIYDRINENDRAEVPAMSAEERKAEKQDLHRASSRWTEAQESLAAARELATDR